LIANFPCIKIFFRLIAFVAVMVVIDNLWVLPGVLQTDQVLAKPEFEKEALLTIGTESGKGNIIGIQHGIPCR
jgi:hypothetical protein